MLILSVALYYLHNINSVSTLLFFVGFKVGTCLKFKLLFQTEHQENRKVRLDANVTGTMHMETQCLSLKESYYAFLFFLTCQIVILNDAKASHNEVHAFGSEPCRLF